MSAPITIVVADDHPLYRDGIAGAIERASDLSLVSVCSSGDEALEAIRGLRPTIAVVDLRMPGFPALELAATLELEGIPTRVVVLSAHVDGAVVVDAFADGVAGYIPKDATREEICDALRAVAAGRTLIDQRVQPAMAEELQRRRGRASVLLTVREQEILELLAEGLSAPAIAGRLVIGTTTVKTHLGNLYEKLGVSDRAAAVAEGMRRGLLH